MGCSESSESQNVKKDVMYLSKDGTNNKEKLLKINPQNLKFFIKGVGAEGKDSILEMQGKLTETEEGHYIITPLQVKDQGKIYSFQN